MTTKPQPEAQADAQECRFMEHWVLVAMCALVIGVYAWGLQPGLRELASSSAADTYYNLLVRGLRAGQLSLKKEVPPRLAQLADSYDPAALVPLFREVGDLSYYKGKPYLYFGVTPALVLFWPYVALTGGYLPQHDAVLIFCVIGFLVSVGLLRALWRRYFAHVNVGVMAAGTLAVGLATLMPLFLARCDIYEVSISCGYALTMLALAAIWKALHESQRRCRWLAAASLAYGLAVGARPSLLFGAVILLIPVMQAWRERRTVSAALLAAVVPIGLIGLGLMLYNVLRFDSPFEFGGRYQLAGIHPDTPFHFRHLWFNIRTYFLEPARWSSRFPFVHDIKVPPLPAGHGSTEHPFGVLTNIPLVWLALAVPLAWRGHSVAPRPFLRRFWSATGMLFGICALTVCPYFGTCARYQVDFLPALVLLAVIGIMSLERALSPTSELGLTHWLVSRRSVRCGWILLLGCSVAFNLLASFGQIAEAHNNLGLALAQQGRVQEAVESYDQALRLNPDFAEAHNNLASALMRQGRLQGAINHYEQAVRIKPDFAEAHCNLGIALVQLGRLEEAIEHWKQALEIKPNDDFAHYNWGLALVRLGRLEEASEHWKQALRIDPNLADAHYNLGIVLERLGRVPEAIQQYQEALRIRPDFLGARSNLARVQAAP